MRCDTPMTFEEAKTRLGIVDRQPIPMTNEEWFCNLSAEEKAEFSMRVFKNCTWCLDGGSPQECPFNAFLDCPAESKENMVKWLKEIHNDKQ